MSGNIIDQGHFELFESKRSNRLLMLNDNQWYRWQWDAPIQKLYLTKGVVDKSGDNEYDVLMEGRFYIVLSTTGEYAGFHYLLLENRDYFNVYRLPQALPNSMDIEAEIVDVKEKVLSEQIDSYLYDVKLS